MSELKFYLQEGETDMEIALKKSKKYYDWLGEGKSEEDRHEIIFSDLPGMNVCPVGSIEFVTEYFKVLFGWKDEEILPSRLRPVPLSSIKGLNYCGRSIEVLNGGRILTTHGRSFCKSLTTLKDDRNGWYKEGEELGESALGWECTEELENIMGEYRIFLGRNYEILDIRPYIGFKFWPDVKRIEEIIEKVIKPNFKDETISFDVVISKETRGIWEGVWLLEIHRYFSLGLYGFDFSDKLPFLMMDWWKGLRREVSRIKRGINSGKEGEANVDENN